MRDIVFSRIEADISLELLLPETPASVLADLTLAVTQGMSVLARDGADRDSLLAIVDAAMTSWTCYEV